MMYDHDNNKNTESNIWTAGRLVVHYTQDELETVTILRYLDNNTDTKSVRYIEVKNVDHDIRKKHRFTKRTE